MGGIVPLMLLDGKCHINQNASAPILDVTRWSNPAGVMSMLASRLCVTHASSGYTTADSGKLLELHSWHRHRGALIVWQMDIT